MDNTIQAKVQKGFLDAKEITKKQAKTFYFSSFFLTPEKRKAAYAVYALCRRCDNSVDDADKASSESNLKSVIYRIEAVYSGGTITEEYLLAFKETVNTYNIPIEYFHDLIEGMKMDLTKSRYKDFAELKDYCYKAAGVIGLIMLKIFGHKDEAALCHAVKLGIAMQLTNILRDVKEDYIMGRIYLPEAELKKFCVEKDTIPSGTVSENFKDLVAFQIIRAREYYKEAAAGIKLINDLPCRFVVCAMKDIYAGILTEIENNDYDVMSKRAQVGLLGKILILIKIIFKGEYL